MLSCAIVCIVLQLVLNAFNCQQVFQLTVTQSGTNVNKLKSNQYFRAVEPHFGLTNGSKIQTHKEVMAERFEDTSTQRVIGEWFEDTNTQRGYG